jgi:hypothetical protein
MIKAASLFAAGHGATAGAISPAVAALTEGALKSMLLTKLKIALVLVLVVALACFGAGMLLHTAPAAEKPTSPKEAKGKDKKPASSAKKAAKATKVTFTIGMARLEKVDDANFVITATYVPRLPKASLLAVRREFPKESEKAPNDQTTYVAVNRLVNINVREDVKIQDHKGKKLKLRHLRAEMEAQAKDILKRLKRRYPKTDVKSLKKVFPRWVGIGVTLELQADGVRLVVVGIKKLPPPKPIKLGKKAGVGVLSAVNVAKRTITVTTHEKKVVTYYVPKKGEKFQYINSPKGSKPVVWKGALFSVHDPSKHPVERDYRLHKLKDLQTGSRVLSVSTYEFADGKVVLTGITVVPPGSPALK